MYVQLKKVIIVFIFLFSIIGLLTFQNYQLKGTFYNVLLVSPEDDTTSESLTKIVWDQVSNLNVDEDITKYYTNINYKYLEVKNPQDLKRNLENQNGINDMIIIIGDTYNEYLKDYIDSHPTSKVVLIENTSKISGESVYKINIDWEELFLNARDYLNKEIKELKKDNKLGKEEKLKVVYFLSDIEDEKYKTFNKMVQDLDVELIPIDITDSNLLKNIEQKYKDGINYFINFNFNLQTDITKQLVSLQKENITKLYDYQNSKKDNQEEKTLEKVEYKAISYLSVYSPNLSIGEYDYALADEGYTRNIIVNDVNLNYYDILKSIIINKDYKKNTTLNKKDKTLVINQNIKGE